MKWLQQNTTAQPYPPFPFFTRMTNMPEISDRCMISRVPCPI
ncbi:Uncharacterized protein dnm_045910 [Desulfonema magnum]|uniref:Uncharacterized protein n=1 Tax=Desulfonema magnum TaxID=45655 RepID=A0A975GP90_9BACT|nr:Uncharacterized protein dnm_045910 [Desulfonema magnum]